MSERKSIDPVFEEIMGEIMWFDEQDKREKQSRIDLFKNAQEIEKLANEQAARSRYIEMLKRQEKPMCQVVQERQDENNAYSRREVRRKSIPEIKEAGIVFLKDVNSQFFGGKGRLLNWQRIDNMHPHLGRSHYVEQAVTRLVMPNSNIIGFSIPLREEGGKGMLPDDFMFSKISFGGMECPERVAIALDIDRTNKLTPKTTKELSLNISDFERNWKNFKERVLIFIEKNIFINGFLGR